MAAARVLAALLMVFVAVVVAGGGAVAAGSGPSNEPFVFARPLDGQAGPSTIDRVARAAITWRGGPITTTTGEIVDVRVSDALPAETPEKWAEFLAHVTHGAELTRLSTRIATLAEVQDLCGARALGCYGGNEMIAMGETVIDGTTPEEVVRHEYGHHIAYHRLNTPWRAIDWGPKNWASAATVCPRVSRKEAFPGNEGRFYAQNPGEAWAETYRLMDERKVGITTASWRIVVQSFFPDDATLQSAERDVLQPWTINKVATFKRTFGRKAKKVWWIPLQTPLDGDFALTALLPRGGLHEVALVSADRKTVLRRAQWVGQRSKRTATTVCGQRNLFVRVTPSGAAGPVTVTASTP